MDGVIEDDGWMDGVIEDGWMDSVKMNHTDSALCQDPPSIKRLRINLPWRVMTTIWTIHDDLSHHGSCEGTFWALLTSVIKLKVSVLTVRSVPESNRIPAKVGFFRSFTQWKQPGTFRSFYAKHKEQYKRVNESLSSFYSYFDSKDFFFFRKWSRSCCLDLKL